MSVTGHETAAGAEHATAEEHAARYDPGAREPIQRCYKGVAVCWSSTRNPTEQHLADAAKHRELAQKHRAAAQALRDAEASTCAGIGEADRDTSPFYHREDIVSVDKIERQVQGRASELRGARAVFRAVPGLTAEWLQRAVDCHRARAAAMGFEMEGMEYCPLVLKGADARVSSTANGLGVEVTADDAAIAEEIERRIQALVAAP